MTKQKPIIIGGFYRSGTTLLRRLLDAHSAIHCPPEVKFFRDLRMEFQDDPYTHLRFFTTVRSLPADLNDLLETIGKGYVDLRKRIASRLGKCCWADKDPENALYLAHWRVLLPEGFRYIHMARHPLDMLASAREAAFVKTLPHDFDKILDRWSTNCRAAREHMDKRPRDCRIVRYEELVERPETVLDRLFEWLNLPFETSVLCSFASPQRGGGIEDQKILLRPTIHADSVGRSRRDLSEEERRRLLDRCGDDLTWLGY
ncbi:Sulfotransferase family protein [Desulfonatronum zhilinae]|nr:Sulfotransferase family protein [Desulfonatronum zhilinae]